MNELYYKPSGKFSEFFFLYFVLAMGIAIPILTPAYIYLIHYIPVVQLNVIVVVACGAAMGLIASHAAKFGKARNRLVVVGLTLVAMCALKYIQWCVHIPLVVSEVYGFTMPLGERFAESLYYITRPGEVIEAARIINEYGTWGFEKTATVTGVALCIVWIFEFAIMSAFAVMVAWGRPGHPFSEEADGWYIALVEKLEADIPDDFDALKNDLHSGVYSGLARLVALGKTNAESYLGLSFYTPPQGSVSEPDYLTITQMTIKKGKAKMKDLLKLLAIDRRDADFIRYGDAPGDVDAAGDVGDADASMVSE
jgi:hypothetical protein